MIRKTLMFLTLLSMVAVSVGHAAVTVDIGGPYTVTTGEELTIPVTIANYTEYFAGELILDLGKIKLEDISIEPQDIYSAFAEYYNLTTKPQWDALTGWYNTKPAALDYEQIGPKLKLFVWAPKAQSELGGSGNGVLFKIKGKVSEGSKPDIIGFGGKVFNSSKSLRDTAQTFGDIATVNITGYTPVSLIDTITQDTETSGYVTADAIAKAPTTATIKMKNDDYTTTKGAKLQFQGGLKFKDEQGNDYGDVLKPPEAKDYTQVAALGEDKDLPEQWKKEKDFVKITAGAPGKKIKATQDFVLIVNVRLKTTNPVVYYLPPFGGPEKAGKDGSATVEGKAYSLTKGGKILTFSSAGAAGYDYTIAVLLDHLSDFVVAPELVVPAPAPAAAEEDGGTCFIATAAYGSSFEPHVKVLREFRDRFLLTNSLGKAFVDAYERLSPPIARFVGQHEATKALVRVALAPIAGMAYLALYHPELALLMILLTLSGIAAIAVRLRRPKAG